MEAAGYIKKIGVEGINLLSTVLSRNGGKNCGRGDNLKI